MIRSGIDARPVTARTARVIDRHILMAWVASSVWRLGRVSARTPANSPKIRTGRNWAAATTPSHSGSWVSDRTSQAWATCCIQVPIERDRLAAEEEPVVAVAEGAHAAPAAMVMPRPAVARPRRRHSTLCRHAMRTRPRRARLATTPTPNAMCRAEMNGAMSRPSDADLRAREDRQQDRRVDALATSPIDSAMLMTKPVWVSIIRVPAPIPRCAGGTTPITALVFGEMNRPEPGADDQLPDGELPVRRVDLDRGQARPGRRR